MAHIVGAGVVWPIICAALTWVIMDPDSAKVSSMRIEKLVTDVAAAVREADPEP